MNIKIRNEKPEDIEAITLLTKAAFQTQELSSHTEQYIVNALRRAGQLTISLVAEEGDELIGHVAVSPIVLSSGAPGWYGLGPVSVWPDRQGEGTGTSLIKLALAELQRHGAAGCVVLGSPDYYRRFGFASRLELEFPGVPHEYFQAIYFKNELAAGIVKYHEAFEAIE